MTLYWLILVFITIMLLCFTLKVSLKYNIFPNVFFLIYFYSVDMRKKTNKRFFFGYSPVILGI